MKVSLLCQLQLSNYTKEGVFVLEADSGYQMMLGRIREFFRHVSELNVDVLGPKRNQLRTQPEELNPELFADNRVRYVEIGIVPNALATRYDFNFEEISHALALDAHKTALVLRYDYVYINDPMHLRNFKAMFSLKAGYQPKFIVHSHFVDNPEAPKFPTDASLWLGQCEAAIRADYNFWQCESALSTFLTSMSNTFKHSVVNDVAEKSTPYDDGYSIAEITSPVNLSKVRIDMMRFDELTKNKTIIFVPNRVGGMGRSSDYTNCGKFMFELLPLLRKQRQDFVVIAGNPSQKFSNSELEMICGDNGYIKLTEDGFTRDEYKWVAAKSHIVVGLYKDDAYGSTASRECIELGCLPLWLCVNEYKLLATQAGNYPYVVNFDFGNFVSVAENMLRMFAGIEVYNVGVTTMTPYLRAQEHNNITSEKLKALQAIVRSCCSYEHTTQNALKQIGMIT